MKYQYGSVSGAISFFIDTRWGCGGVEAIEGIIVGGAPIFRKFYGQTIDELSKCYKIHHMEHYS